MLRSGFLLSVVGSAAVLTLLVLPSVRASADRLVQPQATVGTISVPMFSPTLPGLRTISYEISPIRPANLHLATMPRPENGGTPPKIGDSASEKEMPKPRRITREGCEAPLSSLVGPEARRMVPGRCMA